VEDHRDAGAGRLPGRLAAGKAAADDMDGARRHAEGFYPRVRSRIVARPSDEVYAQGLGLKGELCAMVDLTNSSILGAGLTLIRRRPRRGGLGLLAALSCS